ncbi:MAG TPA: MFS transporter [Armatimonadota bacterium]|jgi:MFS family permease
MAENTDNVVNASVEEAKFKVGTLAYTKRGLFMLFIYLLWGDFCFTLMESVFPAVTPLTLGKLGASSLLVGLVMTTIPNIFNAIVCPWVSFKSDRHRSKMGRRIPFLLYPTPFISLFLILIGLAPEIGRFLARTILHSAGYTQTAIILGLIAVLSVAYQYFNMFVASVYYYLFNDVVPENYLSRFMSAFRLVGIIAGAVFNFFIFRYAESHMKWIFIGCGLLYFVAFTMMSLKVKEGEYPPPPEYVGGKQGPLAALKTYFTECFNDKFWWTFFIGTAAADLIAIAYPFILQMQRYSLGLDPKQIGYINGVAGIVTAALVLPAGWLADKRHPLQIQLWATLVLFLLTPTRIIYLLHNFTPAEAYRIEFALQMILIPATAVYVVSSLPMYMRVLPSDRFGQFCSAQAMFRSVVGIFSGMILGESLDLIAKVCKAHGLAANYNLRYAFLWQTLCWGVSFILLAKLYKMWKGYGGEDGYVPPGTEHPTLEESSTTIIS